MRTALTYEDAVARIYDDIWTHGSVKEWEDATHFDAISYIRDLDKINPLCDNKKSTMELYQTKTGVPTTEKHLLVNIHSGETERYYWGWKRRDNAPDFVEVTNQRINNFFWNDIIEVVGIKGRYSEQKKILFKSYAFNERYKMMVKLFVPHAKDMVKGALVGRFTFVKTGGILGLKKVG